MKIQKKHLEHVSLVLPLILAFICVLEAWLGSSQASLPVPMPQSFIGEYSYDQENWFPVTQEAEISALDGPLFLKGHFEKDVAQGNQFRYYRNHIGVTVHVNGQRVFVDAVAAMANMENQHFASMCGREWSGFLSPGITTQDTVEIQLYNPHRMGNESAYRDFLTTLCCDMPGVDLLSKHLAKHGAPFRVVGILCVFLSVMILGAAVATVIARIPGGSHMVKPGLMILFAGGYILFDTVDASFWNGLVILNTYARQVCMMLAVFFAGHFVCNALTGRKKKVVWAALTASSFLNMTLIAASLFGWTVIFDTLPYWLASQVILCPLLMICCGMELYRATGKKRLISASGLLIFACVLLDIFGVIDHIIWRNSCTKIMFVAILLIHAVRITGKIVVNHRAGLRAENLEKELEDSRISIMLSQIQPHFLYNVLGTIRSLCREDPMQARQALGDFSDYLRGNMNALANSNTIHFTSELRHIEAYLRLEKMRMGENLNIHYDIQEKNFFIPPLSIQPLVENAVKHGLFEKGGGTMRLETRREGDRIIIVVQDDGVGIDETAALKWNEEHAHIGLSNVKNRLKKISGGELQIDSTPGAGTRITVVLCTDIQVNGGV